jgi:hypothetical protein
VAAADFVAIAAAGAPVQCYSPQVKGETYPLGINTSHIPLLSFSDRVDRRNEILFVCVSRGCGGGCGQVDEAPRVRLESRGWMGLRAGRRRCSHSFGEWRVWRWMCGRGPSRSFAEWRVCGKVDEGPSRSFEKWRCWVNITGLGLHIVRVYGNKIIFITHLLVKSPQKSRESHKMSFLNNILVEFGCWVEPWSHVVHVSCRGSDGGVKPCTRHLHPALGERDARVVSTSCPVELQLILGVREGS